MKKNHIYIYSSFLFILFLCLSSCSKGKTIKEIVQEGRTSYMIGTWDISFRISSSEKTESSKEEKLTVIIANETDAHNIKDISEVELIHQDISGKEKNEKITFDQFLDILDGYDQNFYIPHDLKKLKRKNPTLKYSLKGSRYAKRESKDKEYDEIIAKQTLLQKSKETKETITILFEMEKRIRKNKESLYEWN